MSVIELSHRSKAYDRVHTEALALAREVSGVPDDFDVLFVQGGATLQFGMVPMNVLGPDDRAGHVVSGSWAKKALADARVVGDAYPAWDGSTLGFARMPASDELEIRPGTRYVHVTSNETIDGIRMVEWPDVGLQLVADMSSDYLTRPVPWDRFDLVYGGVQKNLGPAGLALVFVRKEVAAAPVRELPVYLRYGWHADSGSLGNTPAMFSIYLMGKVLAGIRDRGGIEALEAETAAKAALLYGVIDRSDGFYRNTVEPAVRSHVNVVFRLPSEDLERRFLGLAEERDLIGLKGHRSVGGIRASLYAALDRTSVEALAGFMEEFRRSTA
jgi:phosphoserine aminotransferase